MTAITTWRFTVTCLMICGVTVGLAGCTSGTAEPPVSTAVPTVAPTVSVGFAVKVTAVPTMVVRRARPRPTPTRFVPPHGPFLYASPNVGPPISRNVTMHGGNLPPSTPVRLVWTAGKGASTLSTLSGTDKRGILDSPFLIPATYPGIYTISAKIDQQTLASTQYRVVSRATLFASAAPGAYGEDVEVKGIHFLPNLKLLLAVYPMFKGPKPSSLGRVETSGSGTFRFRTSSRRLGAGEYMLQAWSMGNIAAQMASTYFQVAL